MKNQRGDKVYIEKVTKIIHDDTLFGFIKIVHVAANSNKD